MQKLSANLGRKKQQWESFLGLYSHPINREFTTFYA